MNYTIRDISDKLALIDLGVSATNNDIETAVLRPYNGNYFTTRFRTEVGGVTALAVNFSSSNDVASFLAQEDNTYITKLTLSIRFVVANFNLLNFGGATPSGTNRIVFKKLVNSVSSNVSSADPIGTLTNLITESDRHTIVTDSTLTSFWCCFDFSQSPIKLNLGDKIYTDMKADYSGLSGFIIQVFGYIQN
jgi:hypothetical protein